MPTSSGKRSTAEPVNDLRSQSGWDHDTITVEIAEALVVRYDLGPADLGERVCSIAGDHDRVIVGESVALP